MSKKQGHIALCERERQGYYTTVDIFNKNIKEKKWIEKHL